MLQDLGELNMNHSLQQGPKNTNTTVRLNNIVEEDLIAIWNKQKNPQS